MLAIKQMSIEMVSYPINKTLGNHAKVLKKTMIFENAAQVNKPPMCKCVHLVTLQS